MPILAKCPQTDRPTDRHLDFKSSDGAKNSKFSAMGLDRDLGFSCGPSKIGGPVAAIEHSFLFRVDMTLHYFLGNVLNH